MTCLPSEIRRLSAAEKFELIDALWQDLEALPATLSEEQSAELDRRVTGYELNPQAVIPWEHVKADLLKKQ